MKKCFKCNEIKELQDFSKHKGMLGGHLNKCKECIKLYALERYNNRDKDAHRIKKNAYEARNRDKKAKWARNDLKNNRGRINAQIAKRRALKLKATPKWLTKAQYQEIKQFYVEAKELQWLSIERLEVDHIIPLQGENVSGLHVPWNLQILPKSMNVIKGNKVL